jgi:hypothetical protein
MPATRGLLKLTSSPRVASNTLFYRTLSNALAGIFTGLDVPQLTSHQCGYHFPQKEHEVVMRDCKN